MLKSSVTASNVRFSHLHLLVKRSRRNNRDSLVATEISRKSFQFSLSRARAHFLVLSLFLSTHLLPSYSLSHRTAYPAMHMNETVLPRAEKTSRC